MSCHSRIAALVFVAFCASFLVPASAQARKRRTRAPCAKVLRKYNALIKKANTLRDKAREPGAKRAQLYLESAETFLKAHTMCSDIERIEYGIARMYHKAGQCEPALRWYTRFLSRQQDEEALAEDPNLEALFPKAEGHFKDIELECLGAELEVTCQTPGTSLEIGERPAVACPTQLRVLQGTYRVRATVEGVVESWEEDVTLDAGEERVLDVPKIETPAPPPPPPGPPWTTIGITMAGTGAVLGTISLLWFSDLDRRARTRARPAPEVRAEENTLNLVFGVGLGLVVLGAAGIGYGFYLAEPETPADPSLSLQLEPNGVRVLGRF